MNEIYKNITHPASLGGVEKLYTHLKREGHDKTRGEVKRYLEGEDSYTLHKITKKKFVRRKYICMGPGHTVSIDVAYMHQYSASNRGVKYLIVFIDLYSRYLTIYPLKTLRAREILHAMEKFFVGNIFEYKKVFTDLGVEFTSNMTQKFFRENKLHWYTVENREIKAGMVERVIRTIKIRIGKIITLLNSEKYIHLLPKIVKTYNHTHHTSLAWKTPLEVHLMTNSDEIINFSKEIYKITPRVKTHSLRNLLSLKQVVRLKCTSATQAKFTKSFYIQNTRELFMVSKINTKTCPVTYEICDLEGEKIKGSFYKSELIPVNDTGLYDISIIKTRKRKGRKEYFINYVNYPNAKAEWVDAAQLIRKK